MQVEYAPRGLVGVLTPQANTTVEPELAVLMPPGFGWINARLVSRRDGMLDRLRDYFASYGEALEQFANAPVAAIGAACTGASYLAGVEVEDATLTRLTEKAGVPVITAATAVCDALNALGAKRICLVSPYPEALDQASQAYWTARGFEVVGRPSAWREVDAFHPIYSMPSDATMTALEQAAGKGADAVVMLGTGMPTLRPIRARPEIDGAPVLSCMLAIAWRLARAAEGKPADAASLRDWIAARHWGARIDALPKAAAA